MSRNMQKDSLIHLAGRVFCPVDLEADSTAAFRPGSTV